MSDQTVTVTIPVGFLEEEFELEVSANFTQLTPVRRKWDIFEVRIKDKNGSWHWHMSGPFWNAICKSCHERGYVWEQLDRGVKEKV